MRAARTKLFLTAAAIGAVVFYLGFFGGTANAGGPGVVASDQRGFDHEAHNAALAKAGKPAATCDGPCHKANAAGVFAAKGKTEHTRCFEGCHNYSTSCPTLAAGAGDGKVCLTCHPTFKTQCVPVGFTPPQAKKNAFQPFFDHAKHVSSGPSSESQCVGCHASVGGVTASRKGAAAHEACSGCHERGAQPSMKTCNGCHLAGPAPAAASMAAHAQDPYALIGFDHGKHATVSQKGSCLGCHANLATAKSDNALPHPAMLECGATCHNGTTAFRATGTTCMRCHNQKQDLLVATEKATVLPQDKRFRHGDHDKRGVDVKNCAGCHTLDAKGFAMAPGIGKDHMPCSNATCHQSEFVNRAPKICAACHDAEMPGLKTVARMRPTDIFDLEGPMNHAAHLAAMAKQHGTGNGACETCHGDRYTIAASAAPKGHAQCVSCHEKPASAATPPMTACASCHNAPRPPSVLASGPWSVAANFDHTTHGRDPRAAANHSIPACVECHSSVAQAADLAAITAPKMTTCDGCHDGQHAFKTTGFQCARCHSAAAVKTAPPAAPTAPTAPAPAAMLTKPSATASLTFAEARHL